MAWSYFLILLLLASMMASVLWRTIQIFFRNDEVSTDLDTSQRGEQAASTPARQQALHWSFTTILISGLVLLLVAGISVQTASIHDPTTWSLGAALLLIWGMALSSGMLSVPQSSPEPSGVILSEPQEENGCSG